MNIGVLKMREQGGWWGEIVQKTNTRHFPRTERKESIFESQQSDQSNKKKYASLQNFKMPGIMRRS